MNASRIVSADIILPLHWWQRVHYRLHRDIKIAGHIIPAGFISDGATSPRILWPIFPAVGKYLEATLLHDYLLTNNYTRQYSDDKFKEALQELGVIKWRLNTLYSAVTTYSSIKLLFTQDGIKQ